MSSAFHPHPPVTDEDRWSHSRVRHRQCRQDVVLLRERVEVELNVRLVGVVQRPDLTVAVRVDSVDQGTGEVELLLEVLSSDCR